MNTRKNDEAIVVVFDASHSMRNLYERDGNNIKLSKLTAAKLFFNSFAEKTMAYGFKHTISLITFNNEVRLYCPLTENFITFKSYI